MLLDFTPDLVAVDAEVLEHVGGHTTAFLYEPEENMLGPDEVVVEALRFLAGKCHNLACPVGKAVEHVGLFSL